MNNLKTNKATRSTDIPTKLIKQNSDVFGDFWIFVFENFSSSVFYSIFPNPIKNAIITPAYKKGTKSSKYSYRPVSMLLNISKIYERKNVQANIRVL